MDYLMVKEYNIFQMVKYIKVNLNLIVFMEVEY